MTRRNGSFLNAAIVARLRSQPSAPPPARAGLAAPARPTSRAPSRPRWIGYGAKVAVIAAAYYGTAKFGLSLAHENSSITAVWAPTGIALAALVLGGYRLWPGVALGAFLANSWTGVPLITVMGITIGNTLEALTGLYLLRAARFRPALDRMRDVFALVLLAAVVSTAVSATIGVASLSLGDAVEPSGLASAWRVWWLGDMGGDLLVAPLLLVFAAHMRSRPLPRRLVEAAVFLAGLAVAAALLLSQTTPLAYVTVPLLIWAALRFGQPGAVAASFLLAGIAVWFTDHGSGQFAHGSPDGSLLLSQTFVGVGAASALLFAAGASERRRAEEELERSRDALELRVRERTAELARSYEELELQSTVAANMAEGVVLVRASDATIVYANPTFEWMFGYGPGELEGRPISVVNASIESGPEETPAIIAALEERGSWSGEVHSVKKGGTPFWSSANISTFAHPAHGTVWVSVHTDISERKRVEEERRRSEAGLAQAQALAHIGSWHWDMPANAVTWSDELYRIYGLEPQSVNVTFESFLEQVHPEDREMVTETVHRSYQTGEPFSYDERIVRPDGTVRWLDSRGEVVMGDAGPVAMHGTCQDITEGKQAELERARLAAIVESSDDAIISTDFRGTILSWNAGAGRIFGYAAEEVAGKNIELLLPIGLEDEGPQLLERVRRSEAVESYETKRRRKDGMVIDVSLTISPIRDARGGLTGASQIARDISDRKQAQEALGESEQRFRAVVETSNDAFVAIDAGGTIVDWNGAATATFGWSREEILGTRMVDTIVPPRYREEHRRGFARYLETGEGPVLGKTIELSALHREGHEFPVELTIWPVRTRGGLLTFSAFARDITERTRVQEELRDRERQLARSNEELRDFASAASHDLREPLRKIRTFGAELQARSGAELDAEGADYLERILSAAERGHRLVEGLLVLSHVTTKAEPHLPVDLAAVARDAVSELEGQIQELGATVEIGPLPTVAADRVQMDNLFQNLLGNALKFRRPRVPPVVKIFAEGSNGNGVRASHGICRITVEDNGIGFDERYGDQIFKPFERIHSRAEYEGSGLGLALCKRIVERHRGQITASSAPGRGSAFTLTLPLGET